ncbi:MAG: hypothetical protein M1132_12205 [Chloroflexi bacterium]|nr:hypothetical protein [Chloroflexota bacterium]
MFETFYDTTGPEPDLQSHSDADDGAMRRYMARRPRVAPASKPSTGAANPCQAGDEAECAEWLRECLNEMYNWRG